MLTNVTLNRGGPGGFLCRECEWEYEFYRLIAIINANKMKVEDLQKV